MRIGNLEGRLVLLAGGGAVDVAAASEGRFGPDPQSVYACWQEFVGWAAVANVDLDGRPYDIADLGAPVPNPRQIFAIGLNYREHASEASLAVPDEPVVFTKYVSCLTGPVGEIELVPGEVDWEAELVIVLGRGGHEVPLGQARDLVAGYTIGQDVSERVRQRSGPAPQFGLAKSHPGFGPIGPAVVTLDELADPDDLAIGSVLAGEKVQDGRTSRMIFPVDELVSRLSDVVTLFPGDLIFSGTPAGVGMGRTPTRFIQAGEELVTFIEGLGEMRHRFVAPND
ncbi:MULTISPECIES: fumarylacetoacetate hydrolase family protein [unclassified Pseudofrankia]|uniref:fumarylacetoacetate hydrolase family protein n=1 Tax=unclassified Pseudofrankia TaxID=2994372 RepID=UPI0008D93478|nr:MULTISPECIES: fumarylacetoacetate hydrolase family protein [unclassified Pseudofrankia]MDT3445806.1 fumarylacetoacetate hydrolase family protein [Pseudofrankia sp. BMG5.37]OHV57583.1 fumarylacetoacetate hydrolase [Pseudofrankia sp. BMG5.36]